MRPRHRQKKWISEDFEPSAVNISGLIFDVAANIILELTYVLQALAFLNEKQATDKTMEDFSIAAP